MYLFVNIAAKCLVYQSNEQRGVTYLPPKVNILALANFFVLCCVFANEKYVTKCLVAIFSAVYLLTFELFKVVNSIYVGIKL